MSEQGTGEDGPPVPVDDGLVRLLYQVGHLKGAGMLVGVQPIDRDGLLGGEGQQAIFVGTEEDLAELGALCCRLYDKGFCLQAPAWMREAAGLPPRELTAREPSPEKARIQTPGRTKRSNG